MRSIISSAGRIYNHSIVKKPHILPLTTSLRRFSTKKCIHSDKAPAALGAYSQAVEANGMLYLSGSLGLTKDNVFAGQDVQSQTKQALDNMGHILVEGNSSFDNVVKVTILLSDMNDFVHVNEVYSTYFDSNPPARSTFAVKGLPKDALVEIEAIAIVNK